MRSVQDGHSQRFAELVRRYQAALFRVAQSRLGRSDWAEEAVQETFLAAYKSRHTYNPRFAFRTWLWTILLNHCRGLYARHKRQPESLPLGEGEAEPGTDGPTPLSRLLARERTELLEQVLSQLSEVQADALRLRFFGGLKFQEIADAMGCSLGTAKNRVKWGLARMSELLASDERNETGHVAASSSRPWGEAR